jgi:hypothetical protein
VALSRANDTGLYDKKHTIMESVKIDYLVEKYFQGETSIAEEKELRTYFFFIGCCAAFRTIQAYFYFSQSSSLRLKYHNPKSGKHKA